MLPFNKKCEQAWKAMQFLYLSNYSWSKRRKNCK